VRPRVRTFLVYHENWHKYQVTQPIPSRLSLDDCRVYEHLSKAGIRTKYTAYHLYILKAKVVWKYLIMDTAAVRKNWRHYCCGGGRQSASGIV